MVIFLICSVRNASPELAQAQQDYVEQLEREGHMVHFPPRDTNQQQMGLEICRQNAVAIQNSDEVHIFYSPSSQGAHFDMGVAFALGKRIKIAYLPESQNQGKGFEEMLLTWQNNQGR